MEDEIPRLGEVVSVLSQNSEVTTQLDLALRQLVHNIVNDMAELFSGAQNLIEALMLELIDESTKAFPEMLGITQALSRVRHLCLNRACKDALKNLTHAEEGEVDVRALHGLKVMHLFILFMIDFIQKLFPMVVEVVE